MATKPQKSIEEQISELTEEQKISILENGKKMTKVMLVILILTIIAMFVWSIWSVIALVISKGNCIMLENKLDATSLFSGEYGEVLSEWSKAMDFHSVLIIICGVGFMAIGLSGFILNLVRFVKFKKKYPYYSDKKYVYLTKIEKMNKKASGQ